MKERMHEVIKGKRIKELNIAQKKKKISKRIKVDKNDGNLAASSRNNYSLIC